MQILSEKAVSSDYVILLFQAENIKNGKEWYNVLSIRQEDILTNYEYDSQGSIEKLI